MEPFAVDSSVTLLVGILLGVTALGGGILTGFWFSRKNQMPIVNRQLEADHVNDLISNLSSWTNNFAGDVRELRSMVEGVGSRFGEVNNPEDARLALSSLDILSQMAAINDRLQGRLNSAEVTLKQQADEISNYLSQARTDGLTKLPNRRAFDEEFSRRFAEWSRRSIPLSLLLIDIDYFKKINDKHGHLVGDHALQMVAESLKETIREEDLLARYGGEEFAIILPGTTLKEGRAAAQRVRAAILGSVLIESKLELRVTVSCGLAQATSGEDPAALLQRADVALYASKEAGRNCAHQHNGTECKLIVDDKTMKDNTTNVTALERTYQSFPVADAETSNLQQLCDDLRQRLQEVTNP